MQKISRIYVGNYGYNIAWYDGIVFDLVDPETGEPGDYIFNLENGGGKTTLLSFLFSVVEPAQDKFLKTRQNKNNRFSQYFSQDGLPGVVLIEWIMPPKVAGGEPYRLVTGQIVSIRHATDKLEAERVFFSFEANAHLRFESVPAPKLSMAPVSTFTEYSRWLHETAKSYPDCFHTKNQQDWQTHLRDERMVDIDMMRLQISFSEQEGGIDSGFLTFKTEPEFVRKFFDLTMDAERASMVRTAVVNTCDKLHRKPVFQRRLEALLTLRGALQQFDERAREYEHEKSSQDEALSQGAGLVVSLETRGRELSIRSQNERVQAQTQEQLFNDSERLEKQYAQEGVVLHHVNLRQQVAFAEQAKATAAERRTGIETQHRNVLAAQSYAAVLDAERHVNQLDEQAEAATQELKPWREGVNRQGALLRLALFNEERSHRRIASQSEQEEANAKDRQKRLKGTLNNLSQQDLQLRREQSTLQAEEHAYLEQHRQLQQDGLLQPEEESVVAVDRWSQEIEIQKELEAQSLQAAEGAREEAGRLRQVNQRETSEHSRLESLVLQRQEYLAEGEREQEALSQLTILCRAAEAETVDPDSGALPLALDRLIKSSEQEIAQCSVNLAEMQTTKAAIQEDGLAGISRDVHRVVAALRELGLRSAQPFSVYLSRAVPEADKARALVASHPARFLGVCVASGELEQARAVLARPPRLSSPVMVSVASLEPEEHDNLRLVVSAADDSAFSLEAAQHVLRSVESRMVDEQGKRALHSERHQEALGAKQRLLDYLSRYGMHNLQAARREIEQFQAEAVAASERATQAEQQAQDCYRQVQEWHDKAVEHRQAAGDAERFCRELKRFIEKYDASHPQRQERLHILAEELELLTTTRIAHEEELEALGELANQAYRRHIDEERLARELGEERAGLKYYDDAFLTQAQERGESAPALEALRRLYMDAMQLFEVQEKDRLGLLHMQLEQARNLVQDKRQVFTSRFSGVDVAALEPYLVAAFEPLIFSLESQFEVVNKAWVETEKQEAVVKNQLNVYQQDHPLPYLPTPMQESLTGLALQQSIEEAERNGIAAQESAKAAKLAMLRAREAAKDAETDSKEAFSIAKLLRSSLALPELVTAQGLTLEGDIQSQANQVIAAFREHATSVEKARVKAYKAFEALKGVANSGHLQEAEPEIAAQLQRNDFQSACQDSQRLLTGVEDRIGTTEACLEGMQADFEACVGELLNLTNTAITLLNSAVTHKKVPEGAPYVGGKAIMRMSADFSKVHMEMRRVALQGYLDTLIDTGIIPKTGPEMVAEAVLRMYGKPLGLRMLKMVPDEALQYIAVDKISNSGGEGVVMAMFLYLLVNQLRSETQAKLKKTGGGPLILDNPFAKATTPTLWKAQRMMARAMDVQLIFATALPDYNTLGEFGRFVRLRKAGKNTRTGRWHLEAVDFQLKDQGAYAQ